ncbi:MAG: YbhB/YbcL family Raf kinase inhibitor-like protein [Bifidobacterium sp.]|jgi:Raf kinase inhibitor-like YbhB/YbcL family protein|nr:YbhB/YbcL family Raf kinase inhibitor-like protein [Bifidobacterium sp.]MCH4174796.1 YbhB/YbcL family Raf kinase inhibitor-like protein [Bifidobacterium sp.]
MRISTDFTQIPDQYGKYADASGRIDGVPVVSFPFRLEDIPQDCTVLHWELVDPDSIPVCGFQWIHWAVANVLISEIGHKSATVSIPADFSRTQRTIAPSAIQGRTSAASPFVGNSDPEITMNYNGPQPPDHAHDYLLRVWAGTHKLEGLRRGFWLNGLQRALREADAYRVSATVLLSSRA